MNTIGREGPGWQAADPHTARPRVEIGRGQKVPVLRCELVPTPGFPQLMIPGRARALVDELSQCADRHAWMNDQHRRRPCDRGDQAGRLLTPAKVGVHTRIGRKAGAIKVHVYPSGAARET